MTNKNGLNEKLNLVLMNGHEKFDAEIDLRTGITTQSMLKELGHSKIQYIHLDRYHSSGEFTCYLVASECYDQHLDIYKLRDTDYRVCVKRDV